MKIFIIIPTYNEIENIEKLVREIYDLKIKDLKIVIVDDNSFDGTGEKVKKLENSLPLKVIQRPRKLGLGSAYLDGFKYAIENKADLIMEMDADFSHSPAMIPFFIEEINSGYDIVIGSRRIKGGKIIGWNIFRKFFSRGAMVFSRLLLNLETYDVTSGFRCYRKIVLENIDLSNIKSDGYAFQEEMIFLCERKKFKIKEIPITFLDRQKGKSKLSSGEIIKFFITILRLKINKQL